MSELIKMGQNAKEASYVLMTASIGQKNDALQKMADELINNTTYILEENKKDLKNAIDRGISKAMLDRLSLDEDRIKGMAKGLTDLIALADPVGEVTSMWRRPNGLQIGKQRVPMGVIGIIYEARPNVTCDAAGLCLKSGNVVILRGGSEAINSNIAIGKVLKEGIKKAGLPETTVQVVEDTSREVATEMMRMNEYIDVLIPRGGAGLIQSVVKNATVPVIETGTGNCHVYVDSYADLEMAKNIVINAKTSRPSVCNAEEKLIIHEDVAKEFLKLVLPELRKSDVEIRGDKLVKNIDNTVIDATEEDWAKEYNDYILGVKIVSNIDEAIKHINKYGTGHSEAIVTSNYENAQMFLQKVDAAAVYVNASTRFTDGGEFGFGAEIGISTQKLHARGPMGLNDLTTTKYIIYGDGQIR